MNITINETMKVITYHSTNYYLIPCADGYLLVDIGWHGKLKRFLKELKQISIKPEQIKYVLLTHHHHDHAALVEDLRELTPFTLIVHKTQVDYIAIGITDSSDIKQINFFIKFIDRITRPFIRYYYRPIGINQKDIIINRDIDDEALRRIGINGKIIHTPGHSRDSISIVLDDGTAIVGDLLMNVLGLVSHSPLPIEAEDYETVITSLLKIRELGAKQYYPSHGGLIGDKTVEQKILDAVG